MGDLWKKTSVSDFDDANVEMTDGAISINQLYFIMPCDALWLLTERKSKCMSGPYFSNKRE